MKTPTRSTRSRHPERSEGPLYFAFRRSAITPRRNDEDLGTMQDINHGLSRSIRTAPCYRSLLRAGMLLHRPLFFLTLAFIGLAVPGGAHPQHPNQIYAQIKPQPSPPHWCQPQIADDPAHTTSNSCAAYSECLGAIGLHDDVDRPPFSGLSDTQVAWVRKCHQNLYNAAHSNPQITGSNATQDWLEHNVYPGTAAKPSSPPAASR
jgi:hypothetical protein